MWSEALSTVGGALARPEEVWVCLPFASLLTVLSWASHLIFPVLHLHNWSSAWPPVIAWWMLASVIIVDDDSGLCQWFKHFHHTIFDNLKEYSWVTGIIIKHTPSNPPPIYFIHLCSFWAHDLPNLQPFTTVLNYVYHFRRLKI